MYTLDYTQVYTSEAVGVLESCEYTKYTPLYLMSRRFTSLRSFTLLTRIITRIITRIDVEPLNL